MNIKIIEAKLYSKLTQNNEIVENQILSTPEDNRVVILLDLKSSTNHRFHRGPIEAYKRTEMFYHLVQNVFGSAKSINIIKELGDGILAIGTDEIEALEACLLTKKLETMVSKMYSDSIFPFSIKVGIGFGQLKRLDRFREDFLGEPIDELSKILSEKSDPNSILLSRPYYEEIKELLTGYNFLSIENIKFWKDEGNGIVHDPIDYYPVHIDFDAMSDHEEHFLPWEYLSNK